jgi:hypothetical protein
MKKGQKYAKKEYLKNKFSRIVGKRKKYQLEVGGGGSTIIPEVFLSALSIGMC